MFKISKKDMKVINKNRYKNDSPIVRKRLNVIVIFQKTQSKQKTSELTDIPRRTVEQYIHEYIKHGLDYILVTHYPERHSELMEYQDEILEEFELNPPKSIPEAKSRIMKITGVSRSDTQIRKYLNKIGLSRKKPVLIPMAKSDTSLKEKIQAQSEYVENVIKPHIEKDRNNEETLLFMDACHVQLAVTLCFIWSASKHYIKAFPKQGRVSIIGAVTPYGSNQIFKVIDGNVNAYEIAHFLADVRESIPSGKISIVLDNANYHKTDMVLKLAKELDINLLFLPTASPNLNIIERVWGFVKKKFVYNNCFLSQDDLILTLSKSLKKLGTKYSKDMNTLLSCKFHMFDASVQFLAA